MGLKIIVKSRAKIEVVMITDRAGREEREIMHESRETPVESSHLQSFSTLLGQDGEGCSCSKQHNAHIQRSQTENLRKISTNARRAFSHRSLETRRQRAATSFDAPSCVAIAESSCGGNLFGSLK